MKRFCSLSLSLWFPFCDLSPGLRTMMHRSPPPNLVPRDWGHSSSIYAPMREITNVTSVHRSSVTVPCYCCDTVLVAEYCWFCSCVANKYYYIFSSGSQTPCITKEVLVFRLHIAVWIRCVGDLLLELRRSVVISLESTRIFSMKRFCSLSLSLWFPFCDLSPGLRTMMHRSPPPNLVPRDWGHSSSIYAPMREITNVTSVHRSSVTVPCYCCDTVLVAKYCWFCSCVASVVDVLRVVSFLFENPREDRKRTEGGAASGVRLCTCSFFTADFRAKDSLLAYSLEG